MANDVGGFNARGPAAERQSCSYQMADGISGAARPTGSDTRASAKSARIASVEGRRFCLQVDWPEPLIL